MAVTPYLIDFDFNISYGPLDDGLNGLYVPALSCSVRYDRTIGTFSAASLALASRAIDPLIRNRGHMRLLACTGHGGQKNSEPKGLLQNIYTDLFLSSLETEDTRVQERLRVLGWMAAERTLQIKLAVPYEDRNIAGTVLPMDHDLPRIGICIDAEGNQLGFSGIVSEAPDAGDRNYEHLLVYKSWDQSASYLQVIRHLFDRFWDSKEPGWRALMLPDAVLERLIRFCPGKTPFRSRRSVPFSGKSDLAPDVKDLIRGQFKRDMPYFPLYGAEQIQGLERRKIALSLQAATLPENPESCGLPLIRWEAGPNEPLIIYYRLREDGIDPLSSLTELEDVFQTKATECSVLAASEIKAAEHFYSILKERQDEKEKDHLKQKQKQRDEIAIAAQRLLVKAALCDISKAMHATLFDEDLLAAGFDVATVLRQKKKGPPFSELLAMIDSDRHIKPAMDDPFWLELQGKHSKQIKAIEMELAMEGRNVVKLWKDMNAQSTPDSRSPRFKICKYFMTVKEEKPRLKLIIAPPMKERFVRYLPYYTMESAYKRFIKGSDKIEEGWMEAGIGKKLSKSMFVIRIEGKAMEPLIYDGHFAIFDRNIKGALDGAILFLHGKDIHDLNSGGSLMVRRLKGGSVSGETGINQEIILEPLHPDYQRVHLKDPENRDLHIIARYVASL